MDAKLAGHKILALLLGLAIAAVLLVAAEYGYRLRANGSLRMTSATWVPDTTLLYKLNPDNPKFSQSFRDVFAPPESNGRIVCLGGSSTYGYQMEPGQTWPAQLGEWLAAAGRPTEVLNAGVPGYGSRQLLLRYRSEIAALNPDIVIIYTGWNRTGALVDPGEWTPLGIRRAGDHWIAKHSLLYQKALEKISEIIARHRAFRPDPFHSIFEQDLRDLVAEIVSNDQLPVLVLYPALYHEDMRPAELNAYEPLLWGGLSFTPEMLRELERKHAAIRRTANTFEVPVIDVQQHFSSFRGEARTALFLDEMHPTGAGSIEIAHRIGEETLELLPQPSPSAGP